MDRCSACWPWERRGTEMSSHRRSFSLQARLVGEWIIEQPGRVTFPDLPCCWQGCSARTSGWEIHVLFHLEGNSQRGRLVSLWVSLAYELIAGKSISRSTHWANWVPVFVWDDGEGVLSYQLRPVLDTLWSVADWAHGLRFCDELLSFLSFHS